ncbi:MAG: lysostaphin resistance A-like protein [Planctomycetota bacterium]
MVIGGCVVAGLAAAATGEVIALGVDGDQPARPGSVATLTPIDLVMGVAGLVALVIAAGRGWHRLDTAPSRPPVVGPGPATLLVIGLLALGAAGWSLAAGVIGVEPGSPPDSVRATAQLGVGRYALQLPVALALAIVAGRISARSDVPRPGVGRAFGVGAAGLLLLWPVTYLAGRLAGLVVAWWTGVAPDAVAHETLALIVASPSDPWLLLLALQVVVAAPLVEEVMYRGLVQEALRRAGLGPWPAVVAASAVFTLMHVGSIAPHALVALFVLSLGLGWIYERTGRLAAPIALHALFNAGNLLVALA